MSDSDDRRVGTVIGGKWRVDGLLGSGSMAAVYAVTHRNGARAALKILHPTLCTDPAVCERFLGEGYLTNAVKHPGIVRVLDDGATDDGCVFLVMDLLEGLTLEALRMERDGQIPLPEALTIADKLMDVLHAVHQAGIIHRDLKPQNVFVCNDGTVKLLDFGVARVFDQQSQSKLSTFGMVLGTPSFMSPEQAVGARDRVDLRTDIWSLGATLFTAITGQTVHLAPNLQAKLLAAATAKARSIAMAKQDLPQSIALAIDTSLRFKQEDRWQTVEAFRRSLREAGLQLGLIRHDSAPASGFDLRSDDTQADVGERALAIMVRTNQPPPLPSKAPQPRKAPSMRPPPGMSMKPVSAAGSVRPPAPSTVKPARPGPPRPRTSTPAAEFMEGPAGTFIGLPAVDPRMLEDSVAQGTGIPRPPRTERLRALPVSSDAEVSPHGVAGFDVGEALRPPPPMRASLPSQNESSYPGASSTLKLIDEVAPKSRRPGMGVWVAAFVLVAAAVSGIAFFAVNRANAFPSGGPAPTADPYPPTSVTAPTGTYVPTTGTGAEGGVILIGDAPDTSSVPPPPTAHPHAPGFGGQSVRPRPGRTVAPPPVSVSATGAPPVAKPPPTAPAPDPANPPPVPPDPFNTPE